MLTPTSGFMLSGMSLRVRRDSSSSTALQVLAEPSGGISCQRSGTLTVTCCQDHIINRSPANPAGTLVTYCTDCTVGRGGATGEEGYLHDCSERYIQMSVQELEPIPPGAIARLQDSGARS
jgi:hypothetical protein